MKKQCALLLVFFLGVLTPQFAQDTSTAPAKPDQAKRRIAIGLLRTTNTAEVTYHANHGSFAPWPILLSDQAKLFDKFLEISGLQSANLRFADVPEILPGWNLRLNVHADGQGYDLMLEDTTDKACGYAAITDERARRHSSEQSN